MGRPPLGKRAMSGAERVRRHRERMRAKKHDPDISVEAGLHNEASLDAIVKAIEDGSILQALKQWREDKPMPDRMALASDMAMWTTERGMSVWDAMRNEHSARTTAEGKALHFLSLKPYTPVEQVVSILQIALNRFAKENWPEKTKRNQVIALFRKLAAAVQGMEAAGATSQPTGRKRS